MIGTHVRWRMGTLGGNCRMAGRQLPAGRHLRRGGHQLRALLRGGRPGRAVPVRRRRHRDAGRRCARSTASSGTATCPASAPASGTATGCTGPYDPAAGHALQPGQAAARPVRQGDRGRRRLGPGGVRLPVRRTRTGGTTTTPRRTCRTRSWSTRTSTGPTTGRRASPYHETVIYEAHVTGLTMAAPGDPRGAARHLRGAGPPGDDRAPEGARRHRGRADAGAPVRHRPPPGRAGLRNYWGYNTIGFFAPHNAYAAPAAAAASRCRSSRRWSRRCTRRASRSSSTWSTTTPPRATTWARRCRFRGIDNAAYYRLVDDDRRYYMDTTGTGNSLHMRTRTCSS